MIEENCGVVFLLILMYNIMINNIIVKIYFLEVFENK